MILAEYGGWAELVAQHLRLFDALIEKQQIREVSRLVMESQALPTQTELLLRLLYMYLVRRGFRDGRAGLIDCRLLAIYEYPEKSGRAALAEITGILQAHL